MVAVCRRMCDKCIWQLINVTLSVPPSGIQYALPHCIFKQPPSPPPAEVATLASALAANCQLSIADWQLGFINRFSYAARARDPASGRRSRNHNAAAPTKKDS